MGRSTQGVTLINLGDGEKLAGLERIVEADDEESNGGRCPNRRAVSREGEP